VVPPEAPPTRRTEAPPDAAPGISACDALSIDAKDVPVHDSRGGRRLADLGQGPPVDRRSVDALGR